MHTRQKRRSERSAMNRPLIMAKQITQPAQFSEEHKTTWIMIDWPETERWHSPYIIIVIIFTVLSVCENQGKLEVDMTCCSGLKKDESKFTPFFPIPVFTVKTVLPQWKPILRQHLFPAIQSSATFSPLYIFFHKIVYLSLSTFTDLRAGVVLLLFICAIHSLTH